MIQFTKNKLFHENNDNDIFERFLMIFIVKTSRYRIVKNLKKILTFLASNTREIRFYDA